MSIGSEILSTDYNAIRNKVALILGTGVAQRGYGQPVTSSLVETGNEITSVQWQELRDDLLSIKLHQDGVQPKIDPIETGQVIQYGEVHPNLKFDTLITQADVTRFQIAPSRSLISLKTSKNYTNIWKNLAQATLTVTFSNADQARYFFNSGGKIRFISSRTGGTTSLQNTAWTQLLNSVGVFSFGAAVPDTVRYYSLTNVYQTVLEQKPSGIYAYGNSSYKIEALCNVADNSTGTANQITFRVSWIDGYPKIGDRVDGTLSLTVEELKATGPLVPSGDFTIVSPTYSLSNITAT